MSTGSLDRRTLLSILAGTSTAFWASHASAQTSDDLSQFGDGVIPSKANIQLQAIGALGLGHIQSTLGLIGVIADSLSKEIYNEKQIDELMTGTINTLESPKKMLRRLQDSNVSPEDSEFLDRMIGVFNALQREATALKVFSKSRKPADAVSYERARKIALKKLGELTQQDELTVPDSDGRHPTFSKPGHSGDASN